MATRADDMVLIGRCDLRCSNSFMYNLLALVKGGDCRTLQISWEDAGRMGLTEGSSARITSRVGSVVAPVEVTDDLMPGVVSLPHGRGHDVEEALLSREISASSHARLLHQLRQLPSGPGRVDDHPRKWHSPGRCNQ